MGIDKTRITTMHQAKMEKFPSKPNPEIIFVPI
jgi:hypothetical protein